MTTAKSGGRSILMCGNTDNSTNGLNLTVGKDVVVKKVIRKSVCPARGDIRRGWCVCNGDH